MAGLSGPHGSGSSILSWASASPPGQNRISAGVQVRAAAGAAGAPGGGRRNLSAFPWPWFHVCELPALPPADKKSSCSARSAGDTCARSGAGDVCSIPLFIAAYPLQLPRTPVSKVRSRLEERNRRPLLALPPSPLAGHSGPRQHTLHATEPAYRSGVNNRAARRAAEAQGQALTAAFAWGTSAET